MKNVDIGERLRYLRERRKLSQKEAAKHLGISNIVLNRYEKNKRNPDLQMLTMLADFYCVPVDWLLGRPSKENAVGKIKMDGNYNTVHVPVYEADWHREPMVVRDGISGPDPKDDYMYLRVKDDSMIEARLQANDLVLVKRQKNLENGRVGVFLYRDETIIRRLYVQGDLAVLKAESATYQPDIVKLDELSIIGLVIEANIKIK